MPTTPPTRPTSSSHDVALWAALTALCTNLAAIKLVLVIGSGRDVAEVIAAVLSAIAVAGSVYAKHRWDAARAQHEPRA